MDNISFIQLNNVSFNRKWVVYKCNDILAFSRNDLEFLKMNNYDNHNMALMLVEILYEKGMINEATYRAIMRKNQIQHRIV